jgi:asparagine N-glycosylation enzyme membrane subunit Stt3
LTNRQKLRTAWAGVGGSVVLSLWLRVFYSWPYVFTSRGVDFQEPDAWFHVRTAQNLVAHFPFRSGFDPYALFPGGMNVPTGPLWEYMIASAAWIAGIGSPSPALTDHVAAWLPAILGALCPIPAFWLARRLFGLTAGLFAALWIAAGSGEFLSLTHLGNADHHAAEGFFSLLVFGFLCAAADSRTWQWLAILAGVSLGALFATQPAAVFVPGVLVAAAMLAPSLAPAMLYCCGTASVLMLAVAGTPYSGYDWLSLVGGTAAAGAIWLLDALHQRRSWLSRWRAPVRWLAAAIVLALGFVVTELLRPALIPSMLAGLGALNASEVAELQPIVKASLALQSNFNAMNLHLGVSWMAALPGLIAVAVVAVRKRQASLTLFTVAAAAFVVAAFLHIRMILYWAPFGAILAGAVCAWVTGFAARRFANNRYRLPLAALLAVALLAGSLPGAILRMSSPVGAGRDWIEALTWLRDHSPEPFGDSTVWNGYFPRRKPGQSASLRAPSYGVAVWWDFGYVAEKLSHRVPIMNGFGAGTDDKDAVEARRGLSASLAGTFVDPAVDGLRKLGARYVIVDARLPLGPGIASRTVLPAMQRAAGYPTGNSVLVLWFQDKGAEQPVLLYLEDYYRSVGERLYLFDGQSVRGAGPWVLSLRKGSGGHALITGSLHFDDARAAGEYIGAHPGENLVLGCLDRLVSCFDVEAVRGMHRVFTSDPRPISPDRAISAVKIFEVEPDPAVRSQ